MLIISLSYSDSSFLISFWFDYIIWTSVFIFENRAFSVHSLNRDQDEEQNDPSSGNNEVTKVPKGNLLLLLLDQKCKTKSEYYQQYY